MLPKKSRLLLKKEFAEVRKEGQVFSGPLFGLVIARQKEVKKTRFGFVVSRKIDKRATVRNYIKRLISEAVSRLLPKVALGYDVLFLAKKSIVGGDFKEVKKETERIFRKARLVK